MAKSSYKIPTSLDRSFLDHEINLSGGGFSVPPQPIKVILTYLGSILLLFWVCSQTFIAGADLPIIVGVVILWLVITVFMAKYNKNKEMNFSKVPSLIAYAPAAARRVTTRRDSNPSSFYSIARINDIDDAGLISFQDGTVGQAYLVVGSASILVFEEDKRAILDRVDAFWRKMDTNVELITITTKEPQRVLKQLGHLEDMNTRLTNRHPELVELMHERFDILKDFVGDAFSSIHQYMIVKGDNLEALRAAHVELATEAEESSLMLRQITMFDGTDTIEMFKTFYQAAEKPRRLETNGSTAA